MDDDDVDSITASIAWFNETAFFAQDLHVETGEHGFWVADWRRGPP